MAGTGIATGFHEDRHDIEPEADGQLVGGVGNGNGNGNFVAFVGNMELGLAVSNRREIGMIEAGEFGIRQFEGWPDRLRRA